MMPYHRRRSPRLLRDGLPLVVLVVWWSAIVAYATLLTTVEEADGGAE